MDPHPFHDELDALVVTVKRGRYRSLAGVASGSCCCCCCCSCGGGAPHKD